MVKVSSSSSSKIPKYGIFGPKFRNFLFFRKMFQLDKFEVANFKYDNRFLKILALKYPYKGFLVPNLGIFIFSQNFAIRQIQGY